MRPRDTVSRLVLAVLATTILGACQGGDQVEPDWTPPRVAAEPQVQVTEFRHDVLFSPGSSLIARSEEESLRRFLTQVGLGPHDHISVLGAAPSAGELPELGLLGQRRQAAVVRLLADRGVPSRSTRAAQENLEPARQSIVVLVRRDIVSLPACPDWTGEPGANGDNRPLRNWRCATAVNFGMMLADPNDLLLGRNPGYADGEYLARSVEQYRKGKTRDLIRDAASGEIFPSAAPSSSSSGNGN